MCGICGIIDLNNKISKEERKSFVQQMNAQIFHRGPDGEGFYHDNYASLAMRRLSIIDLKSGNQPLWNEERSICAFMNGEIYNYRELKQDLQDKGHVFYTTSDTEVLVHLYETYGEKFTKHLKGMFTYCVYDLKKEQFLLARDRFGEKPFYYNINDDVFSFSSEVKSLLQNTKIRRKLDHESLLYYLGSAYVPEPLTLIEGVRTLPPGHQMIIDKSGININPYFNINYTPSSSLITNMEEAVEFIDPFLKKAVSRQQVSDVPIGAFLSGGIDSSTICTLLQEQSSNPIDTFTVKFEDASYDESHIAKEVAERIGSNHHQIVIPNQEFSEDIFWEIIDHVGLPFPDSSSIPVYFISKEIRKYVKVALSGDGGDEIFAGYPVFGWWKKISKVTKFPLWSRKAMLALTNSNLIPLNETKTRQIKRGLTASLKGESGISMEIHRMFFDDEISKLMMENPSFDFSHLTDVPTGYKDWTPLRKSMYYRLKFNLTTDMLIKVDRMSMANALEVRAPFLDPDLFNASLSLADDLMYDGKIGKKVIREIMKNKLPESVFNHPKSGFSIPLHKYQNKKYEQLSERLLHQSNPLFQILDFSKVNQLNKITFSKPENIRDISIYRSSHQHWTILMLAGWIKRFNIEVT